MFDWWHSLTEEQKQDIVKEAESKYKDSLEGNCYWCGSKLRSGGNYDKTSNAHDPRFICKGECKARRFFDEPEFE